MIHPLGIPSAPIDLLRPLHYGGQRATPLGYHRLERERIHLLLIDDAELGLATLRRDAPTTRMPLSPSFSIAAQLRPPARPPRSVADDVHRVELTTAALEKAPLMASGLSIPS